MSMPNIPDVKLNNLDITTDQVADLLLASIAFEELGLAHIINAEAEKIQFVLGTLDGPPAADPSVNDLERIDKSVDRILKDVIKKEILLQFKFEDVLDFLLTTTTTTSTTTTTTTTTTSTTSTTSTTTTTTQYDLIL